MLYQSNVAHKLRLVEFRGAAKATALSSREIGLLIATSDISWSTYQRERKFLSL